MLDDDAGPDVDGVSVVWYPKVMRGCVSVTGVLVAMVDADLSGKRSIFFSSHVGHRHSRDLQSQKMI